MQDEKELGKGTFEVGRIPQPYNQVNYTDGKGYTHHGLQAFYSLLEECAETHDRKSHDYASESNPTGNYHFAGRLALLFSHSEQDAGFIGRIGEKVYRLANLEKSEKIPRNESIEDTEKDIAVITLLWMADRRMRRNERKKKLVKENMNEAISNLHKAEEESHLRKMNSQIVIQSIIKSELNMTDEVLQESIDYLLSCKNQRIKQMKNANPQSKSPLDQTNQG